MADLELTDEYLADNGTYISSYDKNPVWREIRTEVVDYDEGHLITNYVWQNIASGRYYSFTEQSNSWADYDAYNEDGYNIEEVEPVEVVVIQYRTKKSD